jgi:hypothetical protein
MDRPPFCKILFGKNGGKFTATGLPDFNREDEDDWVRGCCTRAFDCGSCLFLQEWLAALQAQGWEFGWECDQCLRETLPLDRQNGVTRSVQGFYQAGRRAGLTPDDPDYDPDMPGLEGCTRNCGWESSLLQLVLRKRP